MTGVLPESLEDKDFDELVDLIEEQLNPSRSKLCYRILFRKIKQRNGEKMREYAARLREDAVKCSWTGTVYDENLMEQFVSGLVNERIRNKLLSEDLEKFNEVVTKATSFEMSLQTSEEIADKSSVHVLQQRNAPIPDLRSQHTPTHQSTKQIPISSRSNPSKSKNSSGSQQDALKCFCCGMSNHLANVCRFKDTVCNKCSKKGHLSKVYVSSG